MDNFFSFFIAATIILFFLVMHLRRLKKRDAEAAAAAEKGKIISHGPQSQHPKIDGNALHRLRLMHSRLP